MITSKAKKEYLWFPIIKSLISYVLIYILFQVFIENVVHKSLIFAMGIGLIYMFFFYLFSVFILYYSHKRASKGKSITFSRGGSWEIRFNGKVFSRRDIKSVEKYLTISKYNDRFDWSLWGHYYYLVFNTHSGSRITLPGLMVDDSLNLDSVNIIKKKKIFPIPNKDLLVQPPAGPH